ncbi:MAG: DUF6265 family protein [Planctomycetota bacterium]|nr:DUF6265 family protein [Planctomycetota bacterium]
MLRALLLPLPLLLVFVSSSPPHQDTNAKPAATNPKIEDFAWLAGEWRGEGFGGTCEEIWSHPLAGTMVGTFRLVRGGEVVFYEIMVIGPDAEGFALKVKHFSKEFVSWEDQQSSVRFAYESVKKDDARFSGLTLVRNDDQLDIKLRMRGGDGSMSWQPIQLKRYPPRKPNK